MVTCMEEYWWCIFGACGGDVAGARGAQWTAANAARRPTRSYSGGVMTAPEGQPLLREGASNAYDAMQVCVFSNSSGPTGTVDTREVPGGYVLLEAAADEPAEEPFADTVPQEEEEQRIAEPVSRADAAQPVVPDTVAVGADMTQDEEDEQVEKDAAVGSPSSASGTLVERRTSGSERRRRSTRPRASRVSRRRWTSR